MKKASARLSVAQKKALVAGGRTTEWSRTIYGSPQSKANSRQQVRIKDRIVFIKSQAALAYLSDFLKQCPTLDPMYECDIEIMVDIYYSSRRPDLDESLIMDALQGKVYRNDRQIRRKIVTGHVDKDNPRAELYIRPYAAEEPDTADE